MMGFFGMNGVWGWLMMGLFWIGIIVVAVVLIGVVLSNRTNITPPTSKPDAPTGQDALENPLDILKRRYASGEITEAQYQAMRQNIE
jgi:putative membrane protein